MTTRDATVEARAARRKGRVEETIAMLASGLGNGVGWLAQSGVLFVVFAVIWVAFAAGLLWSQGSVDQAWQTLGDLPLLLQAVVWVLFLPVMIGLWAWESAWPLLIRLTIVGGLAAWNLWMFLPRTAQTPRP